MVAMTPSSTEAHARCLRPVLQKEILLIEEE